MFLSPPSIDQVGDVCLGADPLIIEGGSSKTLIDIGTRNVFHIRALARRLASHGVGFLDAHRLSADAMRPTTEPAEHRLGSCRPFRRSRDLAAMHGFRPFALRLTVEKHLARDESIGKIFLTANSLKDMRPALTLAQESSSQVAKAAATRVELDEAASVGYAMNHYPLVDWLLRAPKARV